MQPLHRYSWMAAAFFIAVAFGLIWFAGKRIEHFEKDERERLAQRVSTAATGIADAVTRLQSLTAAFAEDHARLLNDFADPLGDEGAGERLAAVVNSYFPGTHVFTVADREGDPLAVYPSGAVGPMCRADIQAFATTVAGRNDKHAHIPRTHMTQKANGFGRHFDVIVPMRASGRDAGIFMVGADVGVFEQILRFQQPLPHRLVVVTAADPATVDIVAEGNVTADKSARRLDERTQALALPPVAVAGTAWAVRGIIDYDALAARRTSAWVETSVIGAGVAGVALTLLFFLRKETLSRALAEQSARQLRGEVAAREVTEAKLRELTMYDPLTGLMNRAAITDFLGHILAAAARDRKNAAVLFFDLDRFKDINDTLGHGYGDILLREASQRMKSCLRGGDVMARWGGDEFVVVMPAVSDPTQCAVMANKLREVMQKPFKVDKHTVHTTISIGISVFPNGGLDVETLMKNADAAMYRAKQGGRDRHQFFSNDMHTAALKRFDLEAELRQAHARKEWEMYYQPRVDLVSGRCIGAEALLRWHHPERGVLAPDFLPTLEDMGLMEAVGDWVFTTVCKQVEGWIGRLGEDFQISVNLSGREFARYDLPEHLAALARNEETIIRHIEIELTEGFLMHNTADTISKLHRLKDAGFILTVDDFGTGYSSLAYLKRFSLDILKIDRSFVNGIPDDKEDVALTRTVIQVGDSLGLRVIAEGIESLKQKATLIEHGCREGQGYLFGRPMPVQDFEQRYLAA